MVEEFKRLKIVKEHEGLKAALEKMKAENEKLKGQLEMETRRGAVDESAEAQDHPFFVGFHLVEAGADGDGFGRHDLVWR